MILVVFKTFFSQKSVKSHCCRNQAVWGIGRGNKQTRDTICRSHVVLCSCLRNSDNNTTRTVDVTCSNVHSTRCLSQVFSKTHNYGILHQHISQSFIDRYELPILEVSPLLTATRTVLRNERNVTVIVKPKP